MPYKQSHVPERLPWFLGALGRTVAVSLGDPKTFLEPIHLLVEQGLQTFAAWFWMSSFLFMGLTGTTILMYLFFNTQFWWITLCYISWYIGDRTICDRGGRRFEGFRKWVLWKHFRDYFPIHLIKTAELDPSKNYIIGYHPHGILCAGAWCSFGTEAANFSKLFPGLTPYLMTLKVQLIQPLYRDFLMLSGAVNCGKESIDHIMKKEEMGQTLCLVIGGAKESLDAHPGSVELYLRRRKGFCKVALKYGASLVPTFAFGENDIYGQVSNPPGSLLRRLQNYFLDLFSFAPLLFLGRGSPQLGFGIVPYRKPIYVVVGSPIEVSQNKNPSQVDIDNLHAAYIEALRELYNKYKDRYSAYPHIEMKIK